MAVKKQSPAPGRQIGMVVTPGEMRLIEQKTGQKSTRQLNPKQIEALERTEHEVAFGGAKAAGKSHCGVHFLIKGNMHEPHCASRRYPDCDCGHPLQPKHHYQDCANLKSFPCNCAFPDYDRDGNPILVNRSYIYHPKYLGCVIRKNSTDLHDWVREASEIYKLVGGEYKEGKMQFEFPSGAIIYCGHYADENTWMKYQGINIVRFVLEEATQIPDVKRIKMLRSCCRSVYPEMKAQMFLTFNPGGPGHQMILDRYIEPLDADGNIIPPGTTITEEWQHPFDPGRTIKSTRVFINATIKDNPAAMQSDDYIATLMDMDEAEREAYLFGNWRAMSGAYFSSWRPNGPYRGEPAEANHVVPFNIAMPRIKPWWWRTMACDWGYTHECAVGWGAHDQERDQFWVTDELVVSQTEPDIVGEEIARRTLPILKGLETPQIVMGLSHDAYGLRQDDRSIAELIARGMARILGPNMVHLPDLMVDKLKDQMEQEGRSTGTAEADAIFERLRNQQRMGITIRRMRDNRVVGWQLIRSMMRWKSTLPDVKDVFDPNLASRIAYEKGLEQYQAYVKLFQQKREILPKLQVVGPPVDERGKPMYGQNLGCPRLIAAIPKAIRDENNPEDVTKKHTEGASDLWDMLRYLCMTFRSQSLPEPFQALRSRRIAAAREANPNISTNDLVWLNRHLEAEQKRKTEAARKPIHITRPGMRMRAKVKGLLGPGAVQ